MDPDRRRTGWTVPGVPVDSVAAPAGGPLSGTDHAPRALRERGLVERPGGLGTSTRDGFARDGIPYWLHLEKDPDRGDGAGLTDLLVDVLAGP